MKTFACGILPKDDHSKLEPSLKHLIHNSNLSKSLANNAYIMLYGYIIESAKCIVVYTSHRARLVYTTTLLD